MDQKYDTSVKEK